MKKILVAMAMVLMVSVSVNASDVSWFNDTEIYKASGAADLVLDVDTNYFIRLYESTDSVIDFSIVGGAINLGANDTFTGIQFFWNTAGGDGFCSWVVNNADSTYNLAQGDKMYAVIFDTAVDAGNCAIVEDSISTVNYIAGTYDYDPSGVNGGMQGAGGDWQAIPEPATFGLMAIGAGVAWLVRLKQRIG
jgi:hypothetical protein